MPRLPAEPPAATPYSMASANRNSAKRLTVSPPDAQDHRAMAFYAQAGAGVPQEPGTHGALSIWEQGLGGVCHPPDSPDEVSAKLIWSPPDH